MFDAGFHAGQLLVNVGVCRYLVEIKIEERVPVVDVGLCALAGAAVAEAAASFFGEDGLRGLVWVGGRYEFGEALVDEGLAAVQVLAGGDVVGDFEEIEVALDAEELGGGLFGLFAADGFHVLVGEVAEVEEGFGAAAHGDEAGGFHYSLCDLDDAVIDEVDGVFEAFGGAFVEASGGGGVLAAEGAPLVGLVGGGSVGDAEAVVLGQAVALTGGAVFFDAFTRCSGHRYDPPWHVAAVHRVLGWMG